MRQRLLSDCKQNWNRVTLCSFCMIFILLFCSVAYGDWGRIQYIPQIKNGDLKTSIYTDHQGRHEVNKARAYLKDELLTIRFPTQLPAYWDEMEIVVDQEKGVFQAKAGGAPFVGEIVTYKIVHQNLQLQKNDYAVNDQIDGYVDIVFEEQGQIIGNRRQFYFKGQFSGIVRDEQFDVVADKNVKSYDIKTALYELGKPVCIDTVDFGYYSDGAKKEALLPVYTEAGTKGCQDSKDKPLGVSKKIGKLSLNWKLETIALLSWDISPEAQVSDGGRERLTIWYRLDKHKQWYQLDFEKWQRSLK